MWRIAAPRVKDTVIKKNGTVVEGYIVKVTHGNVERFGLLYPPSDLPPSYIVEANDGRHIAIKAKDVASYKSGGRRPTPKNASALSPTTANLKLTYLELEPKWLRVPTRMDLPAE